MASTMGSLVISLSADVARFTSDMGKAVHIAEKNAALMRQALGAIGIGAAGAGFAEFINESIHARAALQEMSAKTGDSIATLDGLRRQAVESGLAFEDLGGGLTKFARNLNAADDEGKAAAQAIGAIGLNVADLRAMKPGDAFTEIAKALGGFEDGASKVAVAVALMGKNGAAMLPMMKELAAAGELSGKITAEQAEQALELERSIRKLNLAMQDSKAWLVNAIIPALGEMVDQAREGIRVFGSLTSAMLNIGVAIDPFKSVAQNIAETTEQLVRLRAQIVLNQQLAASGQGGRLAGVERDPASEIARVSKQLEFLRFMERQAALKGRTGDAFLDARDLAARQKPTLDFVPSKADGADRKREIDGFLQSLEQEAIKKDTLLKSSEVLGLLDTKRYADATAGEKKLALAMAARIDLKTVEKQALDRLIKEETEGYQALQAEQKRAEAADLAKISAERALGEQLYINRQIEESMFGLAAADAEAVRANLADMKAETKDNASWARELGLTFTSAFEAAVAGGKSFREVLGGIAQDIAKFTLRKTVTEPGGIALQKLFEGFGGSGIGAGIKSLFGGGSGDVAFDPSLMSFDVGTDYVPRDMVANIHQGEKIIPKGQNSGGLTVHQNITVGGNVSQADIPAILSAAKQGAVQAVADMARRSPGYRASLAGA